MGRNYTTNTFSLSSRAWAKVYCFRERHISKVRLSLGDRKNNSWLGILQKFAIIEGGANILFQPGCIVHVRQILFPNS